MPDTLETLRTLFADALLIPRTDVLTDEAYAGFGVDSMLSAQLTPQIERALGVKLAVQEVLSTRTLRELATRIASIRGSSQPASERRAASSDEEYASTDERRIAIVGIAGRFPGAADVESFWSNLVAGRVSIGEVERSGTRMVGGFLSDIEQFDAQFFRISPAEASCMDPQQRLLLETAWHAIEDCGLSVEELRERKCGVFASGLPGDYKQLVRATQSSHASHAFLGNAFSSLAARISYFCDFRGPSVTLDTACSSALVALRQACESIRAGECRAAVVGAVAVFCTPELHTLADRSGMLAKSGACHPFEQRASGFVPAEACTAIVLTEVQDAIDQGLEIYAIVEAVGVNHDGLTNGMMSPNAASQAELIRSTYASSRIDVSRIAFVETHGTGTPIGDPIEMDGLSRAFGAGEYESWLGASKANIGHTLVSSGLVGIIKAVLAFKHGLLPPHPTFERSNPAIAWGNFKINRTAVRLPPTKDLAAISAFGFTGTNAHVVLRNMRIPGTPADREPHDVHRFIFSAPDPEGLRRVCARMLERVEHLGVEDLPALAANLRGRSSLRFRIELRAASPDELGTRLRELLSRGVQHAMRDGFEREAHSEREESRPVRAHGPRGRCKAPLYPFAATRFWVTAEASGVRVSEDEPVDERARKSRSYERVLGTLCADLARILGHEPHKITAATVLAELGIDSLVSMEVMSRYKPELPHLKVGSLFRHATVQALAHDIGTQLDAIGEVNATDPAIQPNILDLLELEIVEGRNAGGAQWLRSRQPRERALLLLPPLNTSFKAWIHQVAHFHAAGFELHIAHYPGHGGAPFDPEQFSFNALVRDIHDYAQRCATRPDVFGWSLGGCLALLAAVEHPDVFGRMVLISTATHFESELFERTIELQGELKNAAEYLDVLFGAADSPAEQFGAGASMRVLNRYYCELTAMRTEHSLARVTIPTLIVHGASDCVVPDLAAQRLAQIPASQLHVLDQQGHFIPLTAPRKFNDLAARFVQAA